MCLVLPMKSILRCATFLSAASFSFTQQPPPSIKDFIRTQAPVIVLEHVRVIDGTGAAAKSDQTIVISGGTIAAIGDSSSVTVPTDGEKIDYTGYSALPCLVGMHDHLFYPAGGGLYHDMPFSFPRLYLAMGVTTIRTTGAVEPYFDLELKKGIDQGKLIGPKMNITGPYIEG